MSGQYELKATDPFSSHARIARILDTGTAAIPAPRILDVGCASGLLKQTAAALDLPVARRAQWVGVDIEPAALDACRAIGMEVHAADLSSTPAPPPGGPFDAVVFGDVLEHLPAPAVLLAAWLPAVSRPGGLVVVSLPNVANVYVRIMLLAGRFEYAARGILDRGHLRFFTRASARRLLCAAGLDVVRSWPTPMPIYLLLGAVRDARRSPAVLGRLLAAPTRLAPTLLAHQFVFECRYVGPRP